MAYVLTDGGSSVLRYPYNVGLLRRDNPSTSFPARLTEDQLAEWNVFPVAASDQPSYDPLAFSLAESMNSPELIDGVWTQAWEISPLDAESSQSKYDQYVASANAQAYSLLLESDREVLIAFEMSAKLHPEFVAYRAALRNPATLPGYPVQPEFPVLPTVTLSDAVELSADFESTIV